MINAFIAAVALGAPGRPPALHVEGKNLVDASGKVVLLKGCNVGNWLVNEFWMMGVEGKQGIPADQYSLERTLSARFGKDEDLRLMNLLRSSWMTERDWKNIQSYKFNLVRIPFNYRLLEDDAHPMQLRPDAWQWLDKAVDEAERHGLYVVLDLHGVEGGQSPYDHTGRAGQNKLWTSPDDQARACWLWTQIASRYRNRSAVVAYDPFNEPYGGTKPQILALFEKIYPAIRSVDPEKLVFANGAPDSFDFYGDPKTHGWHNVGFQMHFYPGLFGDAPNIKSSIRHLNRIAGIAKKIDRLNVPFFVGETNVVLNSNGGAPMMRRIYDAHAKYGWITTMWSYKVLSAKGGTDGGSWCMFTNSTPARQINFFTAPEAQVESYFASFATQPLMVYKELRDDLTAANPDLPPLPETRAPRTEAPADETLTGWQSTDVGGSIPGGLVVRGDEIDLYGGGDDIWGSSDSFRFLHQQVSGDFDLSATLTAMEDTAGYTKAGLMVRASLDPDAPCLFVTVFADGGTQIAWRTAKGADMTGTDGPKNVLPNARMRIVRVGNVVSVSINDREIRPVNIPALAGNVLVGPIALSHSGGELTKATYKALRLTQ